MVMLAMLNLWLNRDVVPEQPRLVLRRFTGDETVEVIESQPCGVLVERTRGGQIGDRGNVPLAKCGAVIPMFRQNAWQGRCRARYLAHVTIKITGKLGNYARADALVIATGQQGCARRRAHRRCVEAVVRDAVLAQPAHCR